MKKVPLNNIFDVEYGNSFDLNVLDTCSDDYPDKVNYVSRTRENNGISAIVKRVIHTEPFPKGLISVAGSGNSVLESFIQPAPFYTGYHVFILNPKTQLTDNEKLYYCYCIRQNQYRYNFGRQANKTLGSLLIPEKVPAWVNKVSVELPASKPIINKRIELNVSSWNWFKLSKIFDIETGNGPKVKPVSFNDGNVPHISTTDFNNGINYYLNYSDPPQKGNRISVSNDGSIGAAFYQPDAFFSSYKVNVLNPKFELNSYIALFIITLLRKERFRYNYGRKWGLERMNDTLIKLPAQNGNPDWAFMETYIKSLQFSSAI
jgi:Type I restriction modification DNA specificity domain